MQTAPVVVDAAPRYYNGGYNSGYNGNYGYNGGYSSNGGYGYNGGQSYYDGGSNDYGRYGRTVYYERGPEIPVSYREYSPYGGNGYGYGGNGQYGYGGNGYYGGNYEQPYYAPPPYPYYRPYYRRPVVCTGGAYETGQAICGLRP